MSNVSTLKKATKPFPEGYSTAGKTKSQMIRDLRFTYGWETGDIARTVGVIYQHARNVINQPYKGKRIVTLAIEPKVSETNEENEQNEENDDNNHAA
jgi:hypothetical protein